MKEKSTPIKRRTFIWLLGSAIIGFFLFIRFIYSPSRRLQGKLEELGYSVEVEEIDKFWEAYLDISKGNNQHLMRVLRTYLVEPRDQNVSLFLLSSNALDKDEADNIQFITLYSAYSRPCFHPFLAKA